jgi:hypothetical protein
MVLSADDLMALAGSHAANDVSPIIDGIGFAIAAIIKFKEHKDNPTVSLLGEHNDNPTVIPHGDTTVEFVGVAMTAAPDLH